MVKVTGMPLVYVRYANRMRLVCPSPSPAPLPLPSPKYNNFKNSHEVMGDTQFFGTAIMNTKEIEKIFQKNMDDHPHLGKVYRDKISNFRYLKAIATGGSFQIDQTFMVENEEENAGCC